MSAADATRPAWPQWALQLVDRVLSTNPALRTRLRLSLIPSMLYLGLLVAHSVWILVDPQVPAIVPWLAACCAVCSCVFFALIRSGITLGLKDPAMVMPQMLAAGFCCAAAYATLPNFRPASLQLMSLVLVFGLFNLRTRELTMGGLMMTGMLLLADAVTLVVGPTHPDVGLELMDVSSAALTMCFMTFVSASHARSRAKLRGQRAELADAVARTEALITTDPLTGLANRQHGRTLLTAELARHDAGGETFALALIDLDHFKRINDDFGHGVGDIVLCRFGEEARLALRDVDLVCRWGGEEFIVMLRQCESMAGAIATIDRLQAQLANQVLVRHQPQLKPSFSAGVALREPGESLAQLLERADKALYGAKHAGRARAMAALPSGGPEAPPVLANAA